MQELIKTFNFNDHELRTITNEYNQVFFVAKDICDILGYTKSTSAVIDAHCKSEGCTKMVLPTNQGYQEQTLINEGNLYRLVLKSKKKESEIFESWVCDEVLPSIRKTGKYEVKSKTQAELFLESAQMLVAQEQRLLVIETKLLQIEESRNVATQELLIAERSTDDIPEETIRAKIRKLVNQYSFAKNAEQQNIWHVVYDRLYYRYGINLRVIVKKKGESILDVAERSGHLEKIFAICSKELV